MHPSPSQRRRAQLWRRVLLPLLSSLLALHYCAYVGWPALLDPMTGCRADIHTPAAPDNNNAWGSDISLHPTRALLEPLQGAEGWGSGLGYGPGSSSYERQSLGPNPPSDEWRGLGPEVLGWLGLSGVHAQAVVALFLALGACVMQVGGVVGGGGGGAVET